MRKRLETTLSKIGDDMERFDDISKEMFARVEVSGEERLRDVMWRHSQRRVCMLRDEALEDMRDAWEALGEYGRGEC